MASPGLKQGSIQHFMSNFEDFVSACCRDEAVGESSCVVPPAFLLSEQKSIFTTNHLPFNST